MTGTGVSRKEACSPMESLASPKSIMKIGTLNVRTMYEIGKTAVVAREMRKQNIFLALSPLRVMAKEEEEGTYKYVLPVLIRYCQQMNEA